MSLLPLLLTALLAQAAPESEDYAAVAARLNERMLGTRSHASQAARLIQIGYLEDETDPAVAALARSRARLFSESTVAAVAEAFPSVPIETQRALIQLVGELRLTLKGTDSSYTAVLIAGLKSDDDGVRREALSQVGRYRLSRMALTVADVYFAHPADRALCLEVLGPLESRAGLSPALDALESDDEELRELAVRLLARLGRPAAFALKQRMLGDDPRVARDATRALLRFAGDEDLSALHEYARRHAAGDEEMGRRLTRAIAALESGTYTRPSLDDL